MVDSGKVVQLFAGSSAVEGDLAQLTFDSMLDGWRNQMLSRNLAFSTIDGRERLVRRLASDLNEFPWQWTSAMFDEWLGDRRSVDGHARSTVRSAGLTVRMFCGYLVDPAYGWQSLCEQRFQTFPVQVAHEWNTAPHVQEAGSDRGVRPFTHSELQTFFDCADDWVERARRSQRKGWVAAFRDATLFKVAYGWGLRRNEARMLDVGDFAHNPHAKEFGLRGVLHVRHGKAMRSSPPKPRSVLTVFGWSVDCVDEWVREVRPFVADVGERALWPTERHSRIGLSRIGSRFRDIRTEAELDDALTFHSFRRSYVTHLIEDGFDARFVQDQVGHEHASTTSIYTAVSSDFRVKSLRRSLDAAGESILNTGVRTSKEDS